MPYLLVFAIWSVLWVPVSMLFASNPHFPSALVSPVFGFVCLQAAGSLDRHSKLFAEVTLPFVAYWLGLAILWAGCLLRAQVPARLGNPHAWRAARPEVRLLRS